MDAGHVIAPPVERVRGVLFAVDAGQVYILRTTGNAYLCGGDPTTDDAAEVLVYCQADYRTIREWYTVPHRMARMKMQIAARLANLPTADIHAAITDYVRSCTRLPGHKYMAPAKGEQARKMTTAPLEWILAEYAASGDPAKLDRAWDAPYSVVACMMDAKRDITGEDGTLITEADDERLDAKLAKVRVS